MTSVDDASTIAAPPHDFGAVLRQLCEEADRARAGGESRSFGQGVYTLSGRRLLVTPRANGDSRYPFVHDGMNFWAYGSGYMHANDGLFALFPRRTEGQEPGIAFMAATAGEIGWQPFSLLGVPHMPEDDVEPAERFAVFAPASVTYVTRKGGLAFLARVFPAGPAHVACTLLVVNEDAASRTLLLSSFFNPMLRHQIHETDEDRWFRDVRVLRRAGHAASFLFHVNEDKDRHTSLAQYAVIDRAAVLVDRAFVHGTEETPSRLAFMGAMSRSLANALSLRRGTFGARCSQRSFVEPAIAGDMIHLEMQPGGSARVDYTFRVTGDSEQARQWHLHGCPSHSIEVAIRNQEQMDERHHRTLQVQMSDSQSDQLNPYAFNEFLCHLMKQVEFCSLIRGYVQLSENSLIGIRDIFQALEALAYWRPDAAREKMLEALAFTLEDGRCLRQYSLPNRNGEPGRADLRPFIDQGVWVISTIATYMRLTGDVQFLQTRCGYHKLPSGGNNRVVPSRQSDSVLDHLRRILQYMLEQIDPRTGCLRALYGDWNDALDGLGTLPGGGEGYGTGVSVMASLQLLQNLQEMRELIDLGADEPQQEEIVRLSQQKDQLAETLARHAVQSTPDGSRRILHGWGHEGAYLVGSHSDIDGVARDSVTSNAFWVLCGMLDRHPETRADILAAFDRLDSKYGLRTFQPEFPAGEGRFGRIGKLPPGTAENAGTYVHATAFGIMALFEMGEPRRAWQQLEKILPFTPLHSNLSHSPFVMPNSYGHNPALDIDGENMNDWQTGSSNVVLKTILRHVVGFRIEGEVLGLRPAHWCPFRQWETTLTARGRQFAIQYNNTGLGTRSFTVNGAEHPSQLNTQDNAHGLRLRFEEIPKGSTVRIAIAD